MHKLVCTGIAVFLVAVLLFNLVGYMVVGPVMQAFHRHKVFSEIRKSNVIETVDLTFVKGSVKVILKGGKKEILYKGKMYDIVSMVDHGEKITYTCKPDHKEDKIISISKNMDKEMQKKFPSSKNARMFLEHLVKIAFIHQPENFSVYRSSVILVTRQFSFYHDPLLQVPDQPPQFFNYLFLPAIS